MDAIYSTTRNEENITIGIPIEIGVSFAQQYTCSANMNEFEEVHSAVDSIAQRRVHMLCQYAAYDDDEVLRVVPRRLLAVRFGLNF